MRCLKRKLKKPMELCLYVNSNVISANSLNTIIANTMEKSKLGEASFYDLFSSPALEEKICSDDILSPICDNSNDAGDISNPPTESTPFRIPMKIAERVLNNRYSGDGTVHPGDHLLFIHELAEWPAHMRGRPSKYIFYFLELKYHASISVIFSAYMSVIFYSWFIVNGIPL